MQLYRLTFSDFAFYLAPLDQPESDNEQYRISDLKLLISNNLVIFNKAVSGKCRRGLFIW